MNKSTVVSVERVKTTLTLSKASLVPSIIFRYYMLDFETYAPMKRRSGIPTSI